MNRHRPFVRGRSTERVVANRQIRFPEVRVLSEHGELIGVMSSREAQERAMAENKDLVLVTEKAEPPVVKIIEFAKFKYQLQQKQAESRKKARQQDIKEVRFSPFIGENDFQIRLNKIRRFLDRGDKVRLSVEFRGGRQLARKDFGYELLGRVFTEMQNEASVEIEPRLIGKKLIAQLMPSKRSQKKEKEETL